MPGVRKFDHVERSRRLLQIERFIFLGVPRQEMAERLNVSEKTIRRDLKHRMDRLISEAEHSAASYRQTILVELGRTYAEVLKDMANARANGQPTNSYANTRVEIIRTIARVTGAEEAIKIEHSGAIEHHVHMVPESELARMAQLTREIEAEVL
jgi:hypothetical protein